MLSGKLIHLIERHEREIADRIVEAICDSSELIHLGRLPSPELREEAREILKHLGHWLTHNNEDRLALTYEHIGKMRFAKSVPLYESALGLCLVKRKMIAFLDEQGIDMDSLALYAEEQLERRVGDFFDLLLIHLARGYETGWRYEMQTVHGAWALRTEP
jgi:hypothetical protein